jgi:hypothetical protein
VAFAFSGKFKHGKFCSSDFELRKNESVYELFKSISLTVYLILTDRHKKHWTFLETCALGEEPSRESLSPASPLKKRVCKTLI